MSSEIAVSIRNLCKQYHIYDRPVDRLRQALQPHRRLYTEFRALEGVSFEVRRGRCAGIIGRNGSGKSTLLQIAAGILAPSSGEVRVNGRVSTLLELGAGFNPEFTGRENAFLNGAVLKISRREMEDRFARIAEFADIGEFMDRPVKIYSSGMYLRLAFAIMTQVEADILLIDEVLAVGDEKFQRKCYNRLEAFRSGGGTVVFASHDTTTVAQVCNEVLLLEHGGVAAAGEPKAVIDAYHRLLYGAEGDHLAALNPPRSIQVGAGALATSPADDWAAKRGATIEGEGVAKRGLQSEGRSGDDCYLFSAGEEAVVSFDVVFHIPLSSVTAGLRIRTVQGVEVYGTSTSYHETVENVQAGERVRFLFSLRLNLCPGAYSLSCAVAERLGGHDMRYLDKRSDTLLFKVAAHEPLATGIADLDAKVSVVRKR